MEGDLLRLRFHTDGVRKVQEFSGNFLNDNALVKLIINLNPYISGPAIFVGIFGVIMPKRYMLPAARTAEKEMDFCFTTHQK